MIRAAALALLAAAPATAQDVIPCDWQASAQALVEPWQDNTRSFANGQTRLALLDTIEPAAGALWLLVLSPPRDELGGRQCRVIGWRGTGFAGLDFAALQADYDPARGLRFALPAQVADDGGDRWATLTLRLNQATGAIDARLTQ